MRVSFLLVISFNILFFSVLVLICFYTDYLVFCCFVFFVCVFFCLFNFSHISTFLVFICFYEVTTCIKTETTSWLFYWEFYVL